MPEPATEGAFEGGRFLTFRVAAKLYALPADEVAEVIRTPTVARVPQGPKSLLGLANLRGAVLAVASARGLLGREAAAATAASRAIVLRGAASVALAVDAVDGLVDVEASRLSPSPDVDADEGSTAAFQAGGAGELASVLDVPRLLAAAFRPRPRAERPRLPMAHAAASAGAGPDQAQQKLVAFEVAGQEYALPLSAVHEILPAPQVVARAPRSEGLVLGATAYREALLPLMSLRGLMGLPVKAEDSGREKVVVTRVGGGLVGLVADRMKAILSAEAALIETTPPILAARAGGEAQIKAIYRGEGGRRLVSILAPEQLFREDVMQRLTGMDAARPPAATAAPADDLQVLVFRLGDDEFGLPIAAVDEVARAPDQIARVPKTPRFLEGVVNLRGEVLPVIDQRKRFDMPPLAEAPGRRLIVVRTDRHRAGVIVDSVSEVLRCATSAIEEAPDLAGETTRLVYGVLNLESAGRIVMLLDPSELLTRAERGLLDAFQPQAEQADA
jgi:purine-binding chemotaxis protein CheW